MKIEKPVESESLALVLIFPHLLLSQIRGERTIDKDYTSN